jgi:hypothetical protein
VYWRRRAVVLGALLLVVIVFFVSCGGEDDNTKRGTGNLPSTPVSAPASPTPEEEPSFSDASPNGGPAYPDPDDVQSPGNAQPGTNPSGGVAPTGTGNNANVTAPTDGSCADQEIAITPVPAATSAKRGTPLIIRLRIKNISARSCTRDLGAGAQELYLDQGARKYWSSDTCSADRSQNVLQLPAGAEREYSVTWNGRQSSKCAAALAAGPAPPPGQYEIRGRLGTKISNPVTLTIAD